MGGNELRTTNGPGHEHSHPTISKQTNDNPHPFTNMSRGSGNLVLVESGGTVTITSSSLSWNQNPAVGDAILLAGFVNAANNGRFTVTAITGFTVAFANAAGVTETLASAKNVIVWLRDPVKYAQDVIMTSGVPTYSSASTSSTVTVNPIGGVYCYMTCMNSTDADALITISGGTLICPAGATIGHEIKPFTNAVTGVAAGATSGTLYINIS